MKNILITGLPGVGKTTLVMRLAKHFEHLQPAGFYTAEIREGGIRKGFQLVSLDGRKELLAHVDIKSSYRVGKYGVDLNKFEEFLKALSLLESASRFIIIDEIGKMECFSKYFCELVGKIMDSDKFLLATVALRGEGFIDKVKKRKDVRAFEITEKTREKVFQELVNLIGKRLSMEHKEVLAERHWDEAIKKALESNRILIIGAVDRGKSTFAKYLVGEFLRKGKATVFVDSDIGQSSISIPGTIGLKKIEKPEDIGSFADLLFFVGYTTPSISIPHFLEIFSRAIEKARSFNLPIVVDTTGFVSGEGRSLKVKKVEIFNPDIVIAIQKENELSELLSDIKVPCLVLEPSSKVFPRDQQVRANYRKERLVSYFKDSKSYLFPLRLFKEPINVYNASSYLERMVGIFSGEDCIGVGYIEEIDEDGVVVRANLKNLKDVKSLRLGKVKLSGLLEEPQ